METVLTSNPLLPPMMLDSDVQKYDERQTVHHDTTEVEHSDSLENDQDTSSVSVPQELGLEPESEMEEPAVADQDPEPSRPQRTRCPPRIFTYNTLGQPTICSAQAALYPVTRWPYPPLQPPGITPVYQYPPPPYYGPLAYPYMVYV